MDKDQGPTSRDRFHAKWTVIAAIVGAVAGAGLQHLASRDVTDTRLLEVRRELEKERSRSDYLESELQELKIESKSRKELQTHDEREQSVAQQAEPAEVQVYDARLPAEDIAPVKTAEAGSVVTKASGPNLYKVDAHFQDDLMKLEVLSVALPKPKNRLTLKLRLENMSGEELSIAMAQGDLFCRTQIADELGTIAPKNFLSSSDEVSVSGLPCIGETRDRAYYLHLKPEAKTTVIVTFELGSGEFSGSEYTFTSRFWRLERGEVASVLAVVNDIALVP